jgi:hypothetical protein
LSGDPAEDDRTLGDEAKALQITRRSYPDEESEGERVYEAGEQLAQNTIAQHAARVTRLAEELVCRGDLRMDDIERLLTIANVKEVEALPSRAGEVSG